MQGLWFCQSGGNKICRQKKSYTHRFRRYVISLLDYMTIQDISSILHTSWGLVKEIDKVSLGRRYKSIDIKDVRYIAIDEFSVKRGHKYMTVAMDLETRRIIYVNQGFCRTRSRSVNQRFSRTHSISVNQQCYGIHVMYVNRGGDEIQYLDVNRRTKSNTRL